jgi:hypothetical protein
MRNQKPVCFVVMPFGKEGTETRERFNRTYEYIIKKPICEAGYSCIRGDEIPGTENIVDMLKSQLVKAALVIADLSDKNANVFYELGFRHALNKPTITISDADELTGLPFNISHYRTISYRLNDIVSIDKCREGILNLAKAFYDEYQKDTQREETGEHYEPSLSELESKFEIGLSNIHRLVADTVPIFSEETKRSLQQLIEPLQVLAAQVSGIQEINEKFSRLASSSEFVRQADLLGVVSIHRNRLDAIEHEFYRKMQDEDEGIDIVGSTIFGLKGRSFATNEKIIELLRAKSTQPKFCIRILLTHWDYVSGRQVQEKTEKNVARYVIAKELLEAVKMLHDKGLSNYVRFYRGAPTCFTLICVGQRQMLLNPYPYEREAFNSWSVVFRETPGGIYQDFKKAHVDQPWDNLSLTVPLSDEGMLEIEKRYRAEVRRAKEELDKEIASEIPTGD